MTFGIYSFLSFSFGGTQLGGWNSGILVFKGHPGMLEGTYSVLGNQARVICVQDKCLSP